MTARAHKLSSGSSDRVGQTCQTAIDGRRAARMLSLWAEPFQLSEPELQILWALQGADDGVDQTTLSTRLAFSPAQVSACVEKLRLRGLIAQHETPGDRRRRFWQCSADGAEMLKKIGQAASLLREAAA